MLGAAFSGARGICDIVCDAAFPGKPAMTYDLLITNGTIVDGTGGARFHADVAVEGGRIAALGKSRGPRPR